MVSKNYLGIDIFSFAIITCKHIRSNTLTYGVCVCWGGGGCGDYKWTQFMLLTFQMELPPPLSMRWWLKVKV